MTGRDGYARAYHWFRREAVPAFGLTPPQIAVYDVLVDRADESGLSWPSQDLIASESGQGKRAVREALKVLVRAGLVEVRQGTRQGNRYRVGMRPPLPIAAPPAAMDAPIAASTAGALRHEVPPKKEPGKDNHLRNTARRGAPQMTDAQRRNFSDALEAIAERCDGIDVLAFQELELDYLDGLPSAARRERIATWAGLRSYAHEPGGDLEYEPRLHDLLAAHGHVCDDCTDPWGESAPNWKETA